MATLSAFSSLVVALVALVSGILTVLTWMAAERTGRRKVRFVAAAFFVHFTKSAVVAYGLVTRDIGHEILETVEGGFDLLMVTLLFVPFWSRA